VARIAAARRLWAAAILPGVALIPTTTRSEETAMTSTMMPLDTARQTATDAIRPFRFHASDEDLADLRQRIKATRWPEKEPVADFSQGVPLATMQKLARYWTTEYDWRKIEAKLNSYPQFITEIDGLDIHFIHVRSKEENALRSSSPMDGPARSSSS